MMQARSRATISAYGKIDALVQNCSNSSALAVELLQSCTKPSKCPQHFFGTGIAMQADLQ